MRHRSGLRLRNAAGWALASLVLSACGAEEIAAPELSVSPLFNADADVPPHAVTVCKIGSEGTTATFDVTRSASFGTLTTPVTLEATSLISPDVSKCRVVWLASNPGDPTIDVTVAERLTPGMELYKITAMSDYNGLQEIDNPSTPSFTVRVDYSHGAIIFFKNQQSDPSGGGQGCTPGYWKQEHHFDSWTLPFAPSTAFSAVFADAFPGMTLLDVLSLEGGKLNALGRHAVAALLNAASPAVSYDMTTSDVVTSFNNAFFSGSNRTIEATKNVLEGFNEQGCPLN